MTTTVGAFGVVSAPVQSTCLYLPSTIVPQYPVAIRVCTTNAVSALRLSELVSPPSYVALLCSVYVVKSLRHLTGINIMPARTHMPQGHAPQLILHAALPDPPIRRVAHLPYESLC